MTVWIKHKDAEAQRFYYWLIFPLCLRDSVFDIPCFNVPSLILHQGRHMGLPLHSFIFK